MVLSGAKLRDEVEALCIQSLKDCGFSQYKKSSVEYLINGDCTCWVGLNSGVYDDKVRINPFVGVHFKAVMKMAANLKGAKYSREIATYSVHMGEIAPTLDVFDFYVGADNYIPESRRLARAYLDLGVPYAKSISTMGALLPLLLERCSSLGGYPERYLSALILSEKLEEAKQFAMEFSVGGTTYFSSNMLSGLV